MTMNESERDRAISHWVALITENRMQIKHVYQSCGTVMMVCDHANYQTVKDCQAGMKPLCPDCASWPGSPSARADAGGK